MFNILITDGLDASALDLLRPHAQVDDKSGISAADLLTILPNYQALIVRGRTKVTAEVLTAGTQLKVVGRAGVGVDNIDLTVAKARAVAVVNTPVATSISVAELTFGLLLSTCREIPRADFGMKNGQWLKKELDGIELNGHTLGVIGYGRIGAELGKRAAAFGMDVLGYDPFLPAEEITRRGAQPVSLTQLYASSDFISLHIPLTDDTHHLLNEAAFNSMKTGVRVVCAARGGVIDESALLAALQSGKVAAAGLDVFETEPPGSTDLINHPRVIATPHVGAQTVEAQLRAGADIASEVLAALQGKPLRWQVV